MGFCIVERDTDRYYAELSRQEKEDADRDEIRYQLKLMVDADEIRDPQTYREIISAGAKAIQEYLGGQ